VTRLQQPYEHAWLPLEQPSHADFLGTRPPPSPSQPSRSSLDHPTPPIADASTISCRKLPPLRRYGFGTLGSHCVAGGVNRNAAHGGTRHTPPTHGGEAVTIVSAHRVAVPRIRLVRMPGTSQLCACGLHCAGQRVYEHALLGVPRHGPAVRCDATNLSLSHSLCISATSERGVTAAVHRGARMAPVRAAVASCLHTAAQLPPAPS
jgi:hypothetical protein